uniref:Uncharacterized protein n=1 Tax=Oryza punctata TaxID=4537 RepID=A0A0E0MAH1_ORYPU
MRKAREEAATLAGRRKRSRGHALSRGDGSILDAMAPSKPLLPDFVAAVLSKTKTKSKNKAKPDTSGSNPCPGIQFTTEQNFPVSERSMAGPSYSVEKTITPMESRTDNKTTTTLTWNSLLDDLGCCEVFLAFLPTVYLISLLYMVYTYILWENVINFVLMCLL